MLLLFHQSFPLRFFHLPGREVGFGHQRRGSEYSAQLFQHSLLDVSGRDPLQRTSADSPLGILLTDVIGIAPLAFLGVGGAHRTVTMATANHPLQGGDHLGLCFAELGPGVLRKNRLDLLPQLLVDDGLVLSGIAFTLVDHLADVYAVAQQAVDVAGVPFGPFPMFPFLRDPRLGFVSLLIEFPRQLSGRCQLRESPEDVLHQRRFIRIDQQFLVLPVDIVSKYGRAAAVFAPPFRCRHLVPDSFGDDLPLVLREGYQDAEKHPAGRVGGVEMLGNRDEIDTLLIE